VTTMTQPEAQPKVVPPREVIAYHVTVRNVEELRIGGDLPDSLEDVDRVTARIGGQPAILGTALASALTRQLSGDLRRALFGSPHTERRTADIDPSAVVVRDLCAADGMIEVRHGVGIDRRTGAAHDGLKHDFEVVGPGALFRGWVLLALDAGEDHRVSLESLLAPGRRYRVGAGDGEGFGTVAITAVDRYQADPTASAHRRLFGSPPIPQPLTPIQSETADTVLRWRGLTPVFSLQPKAGDRGGHSKSVVDLWPLLVSSQDQAEQLHLRVTLRGVLRSVAERVVRTVTGTHLWYTLDDEGCLVSESHRSQTDVPLVSALFGNAANARLHRPIRGAVRVSALQSDVQVSSAAWEGVSRRAIAAEGSAHADTLDTSELNGWIVRHHVAIDRWTGGAAPGLLYTVLEPPPTEWSSTISIDVERLRTNLADDERLTGSIDEREAAARTLLLLALDEIHRGRTRVGWGGTRGYGRIELADWTPQCEIVQNLGPDQSVLSTSSWVSVLEQGAAQ
jgi:CRISPR/Cas system CSM-associated protein Csm3 (group 7 of RAMP superfamily)